MKKLSALLLCICLALGLAACGSAGDQPAQGPTQAPGPASAQPSAAPAPTAAPGGPSAPASTPGPAPSAAEPDPSPAPSAAPASSSSLTVRKVDNLPANFILGMDASCVPSLERSGVTFYDFDGNEADVFKILADNGINYIRVRIWNDPYDAGGHGYGAGNCDLENAVEIGRRVTAAGMRLFVDFHYSDFWADPSRQLTPKAWEGMDVDQKTAALREFTNDCLNALRSEGIDVGMVQIGNETINALSGEYDWDNICRLMQAGSECVRSTFPGALVALHFTDPQVDERVDFLAGEMRRHNVDYDVFAVSYYPYWHGTLDDLSRNLTAVADKYGKKVMVAENAYPYTYKDGDFQGNIIAKGTGLALPYPVTPQGQADNVRDIVDTVVNRVHNGIGYCYWEGTWISVGGASRKENQAKWEEFGSGWASSYASAYDPEHVGQNYGGCEVDNQAFFDSTGHPLESLKVFSAMRTGMGAAPAPTPKPSNTPKPSSTPEPSSAPEPSAAPAPGSTPIPSGTNLLRNPGFEEGDDGSWAAIDRTGRMNELFAEEKPSDSRTGAWHYHFWSAEENTVEFTLEQEVNGLPAGAYDYSISIMGGSAGESDIYAYVMVNGKTVGTDTMGITVFEEWDTGSVRGFRVNEGDNVTVGVYVKCAGPGAWGKLDDAVLTPAG